VVHQQAVWFGQRIRDAVFDGIEDPSRHDGMRLLRSADAARDNTVVVNFGSS
jgi:hypothetical protein